MNRARVQCVHFCRTRRLDELGVAWNLRDAREDEAWHGHLKELEDYVKLTGDANCRATYEVPDNKSVLGRWLGKQRRKQRQRTLSPDRKAPRSAFPRVQMRSSARNRAFSRVRRVPDRACVRRVRARRDASRASRGANASRRTRSTRARGSVRGSGATRTRRSADTFAAKSS